MVARLTQSADAFRVKTVGRGPKSVLREPVHVSHGEQGSQFLDLYSLAQRIETLPEHHDFWEDNGSRASLARVQTGPYTYSKKLLTPLHWFALNSFAKIRIRE